MIQDVFVSYSTKDKTITDAIVAAMEQNQIRCWYAPRDIKPSEDWGKAISNAIEESKVFLIIFSGNSNRSQRVLDELNLAISREIPILPFRIENLEPDGAMRLHLSSRHWLDAYDSSWETHIKKLILAVSSHLKTTIVEEDVEVPETLTKTQKALKNKGISRILVGIVSAALVISAGWYGLTQLNKTGNENRELSSSLTEQAITTLDDNEEIQKTTAPTTEDPPSVAPISTSTAAILPTYSDQGGTGDSENGPCSEILPDLEVQMHLEICDTFDSNVNGWRVGEYKNSDINEKLGISNGAYVWHIECNNNNYGCIGASLPNRASPMSDFYLEVDIGRIDESIDMEYGIRFRDGGRNYYEFIVNEENQKYFVGSYYGGVYEYWIYAQTAPMLKPNEVNRLAVQAIGTRFVFYINNEIVGELENDNLAVGIAGVVANFTKSGEGTMQIDNFSVYVP
jgi:hypothetical protein